MTREWLHADTAEPFTAWCVHCGHKTNAPVVVGSIERAGGAPLTQYACPEHATQYGAGPSPDDVIR
ncbi:hypothetical protein [Streptomyces sp. NPDC048057]|uniref:hypothetical protein n=1 Tax=Streptomyces sp. NPDC048057 TaxID=3155628 RepID=UPI0033D1B851